MDQRKRKKPAQSKRRSRTTPPPQQPQDAVVAAPPAVTGFEASYEAVVPAAGEVAAHEVVTFNGNAQVVLQNAKAGVAAVLAARPEIVADPAAPKVDFEKVAFTLTIAEALVFAANAAANAVADKSETSSLMSQVYELRDELLSNAVALVKSKVIKGRDADAVANIQKGRGPIDAAQDCLALAALFRRVADAIEGQSPITPALVQRAAELGSAALHALTPEGVEVDRGGSDPVTKACEVRDRIAALLTQHYAYVARVAGWRWGFAMGEHIPALRKRVLSAAAEDEAPPAPTPA
jgi:hypothetical protein